MAAGEDENQEPSITLPVSVEPEAEEEIAEAYQYYEDKAEGLGMEFLRAVEACLSSAILECTLSSIRKSDEVWCGGSPMAFSTDLRSIGL